MRRSAFLLLAACTLAFPLRAQITAPDVTRATLPNGLRVVIVHDALAPVVTVEENYLVGGQETPAGFPGMAHAQEHMAFRGCAGVSADQIAAIYAQLGGNGNADTQQTITQYFATVPTADLDVALRLDAACMQDAVDAQSEWTQEKGAIEQEVARDLSDPVYKLITRLNEDLFAGTPYAHDALGTHDSFEQTTGAMLKDFYRAWYAPNNAVLVIAGDVDPGATLERVRQLYGPISRRGIGARPEVTLGPVKPESFTLDSNLPYTLAVVAYRLPGSDSKDYAAARILADVLGSERAGLYDLVASGQAMLAEFDMLETFPKASVGIAVGGVPSGTDPSAIVASMDSVIARYLRTGLPAELIEAAKRSEIASSEFRKNSIPGLAAAWSEAIASEGRSSPEDDVDAIAGVTAADVDRVAREYLASANAITATLVPKPTGEPVSGKGFGGEEQTTSAPTGVVALPAWADSALGTLRLPTVAVTWSDATLANGLRLIIKRDPTSATVTLHGTVRHESVLQEPKGKEGVGDVLDQMFSWGTTTLDRLAFQKALDDIAASESAGYDFSLAVLKDDFPRGLELVADNVLHPALPQQAFDVLKPQTAQYLAGQRASPGYQADVALRRALLPPGDPALIDATPEAISSLTLDDVKAQYAATFRPDLTTIVVIGDVDPAQARGAIEQAFGAWKASGAKPELTLKPVPANAASTVAVPDPQAVQASVTLAEEVGLTRFDPDYYALQLGNHVLGGGFYATRLYHDLRQVAGLVYSVDDELQAGKTRSVYEVTYGSDPGNVDQARALVERDLRAMQTQEVTPAELHQAKALLLRQMSLQQSSETAIAGLLLARAEIGLPLDESTRMARRFYDLTARDVRAAFAKWIRPDGFVQVVRGPRP